MPYIKTFSIGQPKKMVYGNEKEMISAIGKEKVKEAFLTKEGFKGDGVADLRFHGGPDRAVSIYPYEHYAYWKKEFHAKLADSTFGENITAGNMLEKDVHIGDIFQLGDAIIQVTQGRVPCSTISKRTNLPGLMKRMVETGYTGYLCRVLEEGMVRDDSTLQLIEKHPQAISVLYGNEVYFHRPKDVEGLRLLLSLPELADEWKEMLQKRIDKLVGVK
ncbi:MOSC domain-containing protein [Sporosarcina sp. Sa2YVA2]|uniref:MOSC domain-containing protein n=1 Tax=Sporosarcina quadrami TaxID=2762234 RepID=A0ABR8U5H6_9BACL|nr:MOSC domain-containing protein [Sporosarcina quadrami]MBD7983240.1 MOSC domain-containing protein [Sporosarcina quadrami]